MKRPLVNMKTVLASSCIFLIAFSLKAQNTPAFSKAQIDSVLKSGSGITGPGKAVKGNGWGGWRSGSAGVMYMGEDPKPGWTVMEKEKVTA